MSWTTSETRQLEWMVVVMVVVAIDREILCHVINVSDRYSGSGRIRARDNDRRRLTAHHLPDRHSENCFARASLDDL